MTYNEQFISIIIYTCSLFCIHEAASDIPWRQYAILQSQLIHLKAFTLKGKTRQKFRVLSLF